VNKIYLGDSVYAEGDDFGGIILYLENGDGHMKKNPIYMDGDVIKAFVKYARVGGWKFGDDPKEEV